MSHRTEDDSTSGGSDSEKHRLPASTRPGGEIRRRGAVRKTPKGSAERCGRSSSRTHGAGSASSEWTSVKRPEGNGKQPTEKREGSPLAHPRDPSAHKPIPNSIHTETHYRNASVDRNKITNSPSPPRSEIPLESTEDDAYAFEVARRGDETPPPDREHLARREKIEKSHLTTSNSSVRTSSPSPLRSKSPFASNEPDAYELEVASRDKKKKRLAQKEEMLTTSSSSVRTSSAGSAGPKRAQESRFTEDLSDASSSTSIPSNLNPNVNSSRKRSIWESVGHPNRQEIRQENFSKQARNQYHPLTKDQADEVAEATCKAWLGGERRKK